VITELETALDYGFSDPDAVLMALTHRSYAAEQQLGYSYERLEFLGDAVLQLVVTRHLYETYEDMAEGEMAKVRASVVNQRTLALMARRLGLGEHVRLGQGEEASGGRDKDSILADVMEALLGAIYLDGGFAPASDLILRLWVPVVTERASAPGERDYKTRLQEILARDGLQPRYTVAAAGPDHQKTFNAELWVDGELLGSGTGSSKKRAEQEAARDAASRLSAD
jgi:ribonuclease-3